MVKQVKPRRMPASAAAEFNSRQLLLAGLGAVSLTRKQGVRLYGTLVREGQALRGRADSAFTDVSKQFDRTVTRARGRIVAAIQPLRGRAETTLVRLRSRLEARLQPLLARFGVKPTARRAPKRAVTARKPAGKRVTPGGRRKAA